MRFLPIAVLLFGMILAGCSDVKTYVIHEDRVDQEMQGNRGYLLGTPPAVTAKKKFDKRTLLGIDVEIPLLPGEKGYKPSGGGSVIREKDVKMSPKEIK